MNPLDRDELSIEKMLEIVTSLSMVSEDDREFIRKKLIERTGSGNIEAFKESPRSGNHLPDTGRLTYDPTEYEYYLFYVVLAFILIVCGVVGFALYRSLTARERRRKEKLAKKENKSKKKK